MAPLKIGLAFSNPRLWEEVQACLRGLRVSVVFDEPGAADLNSLIARMEATRPDVVLVDLTQFSRPVEEPLRRIKSAAGSPLLIALNETTDPDTILSAIRGGASEYLYPPVEAGLRAAIERLAGDRARVPDSPDNGKALAFLSAKGGCGATTIACHVAAELQRSTNQEVLLADFDLCSGLIGFLMKAQSPYSLVDAARNTYRLDKSYWKALVFNRQPHLDILPANSGSGCELLPADDCRQVVRFVRSAYDWTVADLGRGLDSHSLSLLEEFDQVFLIANLELPALHQAKTIIRTLVESGQAKERLKLVLNRMPKRPDISNDEVESILGIPVFAMLPSDYPELYDAYAHGELVSTATDLGKSFAKLARKIADVKEERAGKFRLSLSLF